MVRSNKGPITSTEKSTTLSLKNNRHSVDAVEVPGSTVGNNNGASTNGAGEKKRDRKKKKKSKKTRHDNNLGDVDDDRRSHREATQSMAGSTMGTANAVRSRDAVREDIMTQVLRDYHAKPTVKVEVAVKPYRWPFFSVRKLLGLAHIELHDAVLDGSIEMVNITLIRYIKKYPRKINEHDHEGRTALSLALLEDREDIADLIISLEQTDINQADKTTGLSPLHCAVLLDLESSAQKLAFRGANINVGDKVGMTPLMLACRLGHKSMMEMLLDVFGAELDPEDQAGWTCLFYAVFHNEVAITQKLLLRGADSEHRDHKGMQAIDWGEHMGFGSTCALFEKFRSQLA